MVPLTNFDPSRFSNIWPYVPMRAELLDNEDAFVWLLDSLDDEQSARAPRHSGDRSRPSFMMNVRLTVFSSQ